MRLSGGGLILTHCGGKSIAAEGAQAWNPVFDVTPAELIDAIVAERCVVQRPAQNGGMPGLFK